MTRPSWVWLFVCALAAPGPSACHELRDLLRGADAARGCHDVRAGVGVAAQPHNLTQRYHRAPVLKGTSVPANGSAVSFTPAAEHPEASPPGVLLFRNAFVVGPSYNVFNCDFRFAPQGCHSQRWGGVSASGAVAVHETPAVLVGQHFDAFYHVLIEQLPRLAFVLEYLRAHPDTLLVGNALPRYPHLLALLGVRARVVEVDRTGRLSAMFRSLIVPPGSRCGRGTPTALRKLQGLFRANVPRVYAGPLAELRARLGGRKLIVLQRRGGARAVTNTGALLQRLQDKFKDCCLVEVFAPLAPLARAAVLHYAADVVLGPDGSGLANTLFCRAGAAVVELHPRLSNRANASDVNACFMRLSEATGATHRLLREDNGNAQGAFTVDVGRVLSTVRSLMKAALPNISGTPSTR